MKLKLWKLIESDRSAYISLNDEVWGVLSVRTLQGLYPCPVEIEINDFQWQELHAILQNRAWQQIGDYLAKAEHSKHQCRDYLNRKHYHQSIIEKCISLCVEKNYIDDHRFAELLIGSMLERGKSKRQVIQKLYEHHIDPCIYESLLHSMIDPSQTLDYLKSQILKLVSGYRELPIGKIREKVFSSLYRKGYELDEISIAWHAVRNSVD